MLQICLFKLVCTFIIIIFLCHQNFLSTSFLYIFYVFKGKGHWSTSLAQLVRVSMLKWLDMGREGSNLSGGSLLHCIKIY